MRLALIIERLTRPLGGLQRDFLRAHDFFQSDGHQVFAYAARADDDLAKAVTHGRGPSHVRLNELSRFSQQIAPDHDLIIGFNKLAGLDVLYCADPTYVGRKHLLPLRMTTRYRTMYRLEAACFAPKSATHVWLLDARQRDAYLRTWQSEPERLRLMPASLPAGRVKPHFRFSSARNELRQSLGLRESDLVWLHVSVYPKIKGLDLAINALPGFPNARLLVVGAPPEPQLGNEFVRLASRRGCRDRVHFLGYREDMPELMAASDLLVHPARADVTGTIILEALYNGLPAVVSADCGYAQFVDRANAGRVVRDVSDARQLHEAIATATPENRTRWSANALRFSAKQGTTDEFCSALREMLETRSRRMSPSIASPKRS